MSSVVGALAAAVLIGTVAAGGNIIPTVVYADYFGRESLGKIRGVAELGVLIGQSTGPLLAGVVFDLQGSYSLIFIVYASIAAAASGIVLYARRPVRGGRGPPPVFSPGKLDTLHGTILTDSGELKMDVTSQPHPFRGELVEPR